MQHARALIALLAVVPALGTGSAWASRRSGASSDAGSIAKARARLERGPRLSPSLARSARLLLERASRPSQQVFHYAPLQRGGAITIYDSRKISGGFAAYSLSMRRSSPAAAFDVQLIREDSGRSLKDVVQAAKRLPNGSSLELRFSSAGRGSYSLVDAAGQVVIKRGSLQALQRMLQQPDSANKAAARIGVSANYLSRLLASFAPFGYR